MSTEHEVLQLEDREDHRFLIQVFDMFVKKCERSFGTRRWKIRNPSNCENTCLKQRSVIANQVAIRCTISRSCVSVSSFGLALCMRRIA